MRSRMMGICAVTAMLMMNRGAVGAEMPVWETVKMTNPLVVDEGTWTLAGQTERNPALLAKMEILTKGMRYGKPAWQWDNGRLAVMGKNMMALTFDSKAHGGPATVALFQPKKAGKYNIKVKGGLKIQTHVAGHALASVFVLRAGGAAGEELGSFTTVDATTGRGKPQADLMLEKTVEVKEGDQIAVRVQARNPGNASSGTAYLTVESFSVSPVAGN